MFSEPIKTTDGRRYMKMTEPRLIQLNKVSLLSPYVDSPITLGLSSVHQEKLLMIDEANIEAAKQNSESWFGRSNISDKTLEAAYTKSFSDGTMNVSKTKQSKVYLDKNIVDGSDLKEDSVADVILEMSGLVFNKTKFSPIWKLVQTRTLTPVVKKYDNYLFQDDDPVESSDEDFA